MPSHPSSPGPLSPPGAGGGGGYLATLLEEGQMHDGGGGNRRATTANTTAMPSISSARVSYSTSVAAAAVAARTLNIRRYRVGSRVLVCNHHRTTWATLVNKYGYPPGDGTIDAERRGPYVYVLATVRKVHFEEDAQYYTVTRADTGADERADAEWMEPVKGRGIEAALRAATELRAGTGPNAAGGAAGGRRGSILPGGGRRGSGVIGSVVGRFGRRSTAAAEAGGGSYDVSSRSAGGPFDCCCGLYDGGSGEGGGKRGWGGTLTACAAAPLKCVGWCFSSLPFADRIGESWRKLHVSIRGQATMCLNGTGPYGIAVRLTGINLLVACSIWYMFVDQARLAFFPPSSDFGVAVVSAIVWAILFLELAFEVLIRPHGYFRLIESEKAYEPSTVRHINSFHVIVESLALFLFIPELISMFSRNGEAPSFSLLNATKMAVLGPDRPDAFFGRSFIALTRLRIFGLVRHWKQMWINNALMWKHNEKRGLKGLFVPHGQTPTSLKRTGGEFDKERTSSREVTRNGGLSSDVRTQLSQVEDDEHLTNATNIGTALMVTNSHRGLLLIWAIVSLFPVVNTIRLNGGTNTAPLSMVQQLQATNIAVERIDEQSCNFLEQSIRAWVYAVAGNPVQRDRVYLMQLQVLPVRCEFQGDEGVVTAKIAANVCGPEPSEEYKDRPPSSTYLFEEICAVWNDANTETTVDELADKAGVRQGAVSTWTSRGLGTLIEIGTDGEEMQPQVLFSVTAVWNENVAVRSSNFASFLLQLFFLLFVLSGLSVLRRDASRLVLGPLRRMLKIVALYAKNPLSPAPERRRRGRAPAGKSSQRNADANANSDSDTDDASPLRDQLGTYETEQLINAVTKITDLLRKCWGIAGAGIISSNLTRQHDGLSAYFNPCVPGKCVYALIAFAAINGFDHQLRALGGDIMILINDVAAVLHGEVYRWGFGDSGQCNKNLGSAFLLVYRIGDVDEVKEKRDRATDVIFSSSAVEKRRVGVRRRKYVSTRPRGSSVESEFSTGSASSSRTRKKKSAKSARSESLSLASLPGINAFTDRALLGLLKTFAGIYRDQKLLKWKDDFRLGAGVRAFSVDMIFGMDAGWAVEGAVGSSYKIDATYLSPHVNMASRMMSACKQYGVSILLSQAVEELLSNGARAKLRHIDTVTVKGSSVTQRVYTYDARHKGVDFFLFEKSVEQADLDSELYRPDIWTIDQDLRAMRQHVTDEFMDEFSRGRSDYLAGHWESAMEHLKAADQIMFETVKEEGYVDNELNELQARASDLKDAEAEEAYIKKEMGDGPSRALIAFMEREGGKPPRGWRGFRPLTSK